MNGETKWLGDLIVPTPGLQPLWQRALRWFGVLFLAAWKALRLPRGVLPRPIRAIVEHWTWSTFRVVLGSFVSRAYIDQPCAFVAPDPVSPLGDVEPKHRLGQDELEAFYRDGWLPPFDVFSRDEIRALGDLLLERRQQPSATYGFVTDRDLHLEVPELLAAMRRPEIVDRAAQLLGPDLLCWRSQIFHKPPGAAEIQWHQASSYMLEDYLEPALVPPDRGPLFQLTAWVAVDAATPDNGCLQFISGTHDRIRTLRFGGDRRFYDVHFDLEFDRSLRSVLVPVKPGQVLLFTERMIHGSGANTIDRPRLAFNFRIVPDTVRVYPDKSHHRAMHMGQDYDLKRWGVVTLRGEDRHKLSRRAPG
ncbi:MAG: phytanoyl-CoA dioxygenase family protein [Acidobacteriota bacterium]